MRINFKKAMGILVAFVSLGSVKAQTDSTDLNFYSGTPELETTDDSLMYSQGGFQALYLDFTISSPENFGKVQVEVYMPETGSIIYRRSYSISQLQAGNLISGNDVHLFLGNLETNATYQVSLVTESENGILGEVISKNLVP